MQIDKTSQAPFAAYLMPFYLLGSEKVEIHHHLSMQTPQLVTQVGEESKGEVELERDHPLDLVNSLL